jgi:hypothetical protein
MENKKNKQNEINYCVYKLRVQVFVLVVLVTLSKKKRELPAVEQFPEGFDAIDASENPCSDVTNRTT